MHFFNEIKSNILSSYQKEEEISIIFPSTRAGDSFLKYSQKENKGANNLKIFSLESFLEKLGDNKIGESIDILQILYNIYQSFSNTKETFEKFYPWGITLLQDFDDIDSNLINASHLFKNLSQQKIIDEKLDYLSDNHKNIILSFWQNFDNKLSDHKKNFLSTWEILPNVYNKFHSELISKRIAYKGLLYRIINNKIENDTLSFKYKNIIIAGFSVLNKGQMKLFSWLKKTRNTKICWDIDKYYMEDKNQEAGKFLRYYSKNYPFSQDFQEPFPDNLSSQKEIKIYPSTSKSSEAEIISAKIKDSIQKEELSKSVIVILKDQDIHPLQKALNKNNIPHNTLLTTSIVDSSLFTLIHKILSIQLLINDKNLTKIPSPIYQEILNHKYFIYILNNNPKVNLSINSKDQYINIYDANTEKKSSFQILFNLTRQETISYLNEFINFLEENLVEYNFSSEEKENLQLFKDLITNLKKIYINGTSLNKDFLKLLKNLGSQIKTKRNSIKEEGINIMGILETRCLDFENVFILSANEGNLPPKQNAISFIPYNLRKGYRLPTYDTFQEIYYAYLFYRLIQRAKSINITYNKSITHTSTGEPSRYILQLAHESKTIPEEIKNIEKISISKEKEILITKETELLNLIQNNLSNKVVSPTAINTYLDCKLKYYFKYISKIRVPRSQITDSIIFGQLLHHVMEIVYKPYKSVTEKTFEIIKKDLDNTIEKSILIYEKEFQTPISIIKRILKKTIKQILKLDKEYAPFEILGLELGKEKLLFDTLEINPGLKIKISGIIDRIDYKNNKIRIIDYKTGNYSPNLQNISSIFNSEDSKRNSIALQLLIYSWIYRKKGVSTPSIIGTRNIFNNKFNPHLLIRNEEGKYSYLDNPKLYFKELENELIKLFKEIIDPEIPFSQTKNNEICKNCDYKNICRK